MPRKNFHQTHTATTAVVLIACLFGLILIYLPAIGGDFVWDDDDYVTQNQQIANEGGLARIWLDRTSTPQYYPLVFTTYYLEHQIWDLDPLGYHVTNVVLHWLTAVLLWRVLLRLSVPGSALAAIVFALHPVQVESVAWITERKNVLSAAFYLGSALMYLRIRSQNSMDDRCSSPVNYALAIVMFCGAVLSKSVTCSLPAALLVVTWWRDGRITRRDVLPLLPMFAIGLAAGLNTAWLEKHHVGASGPAWDWTMMERCLIAGRAVWFYAGKLVWPHPLMFFYPRWDIDTSQWWQVLFPASAVALLVVLWILRSRIGRGPLAAALLFGGTLFPALGFFNVYPMRYSFVADHFQYHASMGIIVLLVSGFIKITDRTESLLSRFRAPCGLGVITILTALTFNQTLVWTNSETLFIDTVKKNPDSIPARTSLSDIYKQRGELRTTVKLLEAALACSPMDYEAVILHVEIGTLQMRVGKVQEARQRFEAALEIDATDPTAHAMLASLLVQGGQTEKALHHYEQVLAQTPPGSETEKKLRDVISRLRSNGF
jgi:protein O-mannosyl-transferase